MNTSAQGSRACRAIRCALNASFLQLVFASSLLLGSTAPGDDYTVNIAVRGVTPIAPANVELYPQQNVSIRLLLDPIDGPGDRRICEYPSETEVALSGRPFLPPPPWQCSISVSGPDPVLLVLVQVWLHFEEEPDEVRERVDIHPALTQTDIIGWFQPSMRSFEILELPEWQSPGPDDNGEITLEGLDGWYQASVVFEMQVMQATVMASVGNITDDG